MARSVGCIVVFWLIDPFSCYFAMVQRTLRTGVVKFAGDTWTVAKRKIKKRHMKEFWLDTGDVVTYMIKKGQLRVIGKRTDKLQPKPTHIVFKYNRRHFW